MSSQNKKDVHKLIDDMHSDMLSDSDNEEEISDEFKEKVVNYVNLDDLIKKKQTEIKELNKKKKVFEEYIIKYLDVVEESVIDLGHGKIKKNKKVSKCALTQPIIKTSIIEGLMKHDLIKTNEDGATILNSILELMDAKRNNKESVKLNRTNPRKKKNSTENK
jgi:hypothetical protein